MTDVEEYVLDRVLRNLLRLSDGQVEYFHSGRQRWYPKQLQFWKGRSKYEFNTGSHVSSVYANRLVWMLTNRRGIPDGYYVDHADGNKTNDTPGNLRLMADKDSHLQGNSVQAEGVLNYLTRWFTFVGNYGREPATPRELCLVEDGF